MGPSALHPTFFLRDLTWYDFIMQKQVYHIFVDEIIYYLHKPCMKTTSYLQIHNLTIRVYKHY
jgi:hypothetical protein